MNFKILNLISHQIASLLLEANTQKFTKFPDITKRFTPQKNSLSDAAEELKNVLNNSKNATFIVTVDAALLAASKDKTHTSIAQKTKNAKIATYAKEAYDALNKDTNERTDKDFELIYTALSLLVPEKFPPFISFSDIPDPELKKGGGNRDRTKHSEPSVKQGWNKAARNFVNRLYIEVRENIGTSDTWGSYLFQMPKDKQKLLNYEYNRGPIYANHDIEASKDVFYQYVTRVSSLNESGIPKILDILESLGKSEKAGESVLTLLIEDAKSLIRTKGKEAIKKNVTDEIYKALIQLLDTDDRSKVWNLEDIAPKAKLYYFGYDVTDTPGTKVPRKFDAQGCLRQGKIVLCPKNKELPPEDYTGEVRRYVGGKLTDPSKRKTVDTGASVERVKEAPTFLEATAYNILKRMRALLGVDAVKEYWDKYIDDEPLVVPGADPHRNLLSVIGTLNSSNPKMTYGEGALGYFNTVINGPAGEKAYAASSEGAERELAKEYIIKHGEDTMKALIDMSKFISGREFRTFYPDTLMAAIAAMAEEEEINTKTSSFRDVEDEYDF